MATGLKSKTVDSLAVEIKDLWRKGASPDARRALAEHPELAATKSVAVGLAFEEFRQRTAAGEEVDADSFAGQFSHIQYSLRRRIEVHEFFESNPGLLNDYACDCWPEADDVVCGFHLVEELGRGSIGRVFLAEELALARRRVVVKFTKAGLHEAETLSRLKHAHIVPIHSIHFDELSGLTAICMPYLGRWTLHDFLDAALETDRPPSKFAEAMRRLWRRGLDDDETVPQLSGDRQSYVDGVLNFGVALCDALAHTHEKGVLHLDLKPSNVLLTPAGSPLLLDFNLSLAGAKSSLVGGTMPYMSPEQIQALMVEGRVDSLSIDHRSDIYSLGVILYQLLSREYPFPEVEWKQSSPVIGEELRARQERGAAPLHRLNRAVDAKVNRIIAKAMAWSVEQRYASAAEMADDLRRALRPATRVLRWGQRHRRLMLIVASCALLIPLMTVPFFLPSAKKAFEAGREHQRQGDFESARKKFELAQKLKPEPKFIACIAASLFAQNHYEEAAMAYTEAIDLAISQRSYQRRDLALIYYLRGKCYARISGKGDTVERDYRKAVELDSDLAEAAHALAAVRSNSGAADEVLHFSRVATNSSRVTPKMWKDYAIYLWRYQSTVPDWQTRLMDALRSAADAGLTLEECRNLEFIETIENDLMLFEKIKKNSVKPREDVPLLDPLFEPDISLRIDGRKQLRR